MAKKYDLQIKARIEKMEEFGSFQLSKDTLPQVRQQLRTIAMQQSKEFVESIETATIQGKHGDIPIRIYKFTTTRKESLPILVYYHGGGFVMGDLETADNICRTMTNLIEGIVVSVDYRLAPEHKFPIPLEDSLVAFEWVYHNAQKIGGTNQKIAVAGESAGGSLAANIAVHVRNSEDLSLNAQMLFYPTTGVGFTDSYELYAKDDPILPWESIKFMRSSHYRTEADIENPLYNPYKHESLLGVATALIVTAQYDPLLDDGRLYAEKLRNDGVDVIYRQYDGMVHGFITMDGIDVGVRALQEACKTLNAIFNSQLEFS